MIHLSGRFRVCLALITLLVRCSSTETVEGWGHLRVVRFRNTTINTMDTRTTYRGAALTILRAQHSTPRSFIHLHFRDPTNILTHSTHNYHLSRSGRNFLGRRGHRELIPSNFCLLPEVLVNRPA